MAKFISRRDFLKGTAAGALGLAAGSLFGGKVEAQEILGKRTFARPMHKRENGVYALVRFELDPAKVTELVNRYRLVEEVFRVQILAVDDRREAKLAVQREAAAKRAELKASKEAEAATDASAE